MMVLKSRPVIIELTSKAVLPKFCVHITCVAHTTCGVVNDSIQINEAATLHLLHLHLTPCLRNHLYCHPQSRNIHSVLAHPDNLLWFHSMQGEKRYDLSL